LHPFSRRIQFDSFVLSLHGFTRADMNLRPQVKMSSIEETFPKRNTRFSLLQDGEERDHGFVAVGLNNGSVDVWDLNNGTKLSEQECHAKGVKCITMIRGFGHLVIWSIGHSSLNELDHC
jgi:hypothetical protein